MSGPGDVFDIKRIRRLVEMMKVHDLNEIDLRDGDQQIRLRRDEEKYVAMSPGAGPVAQPEAAAAVPPSAEAASTPTAPPSEDPNAAYITSPMVGTFYVSPSPEEPPYVKVGDAVGKETTVCIVEAMKVFNEIPAEVSGQIVQVLVENGDPVEFGQKLFKLKA